PEVVVPARKMAPRESTAMPLPLSDPDPPKKVEKARDGGWVWASKDSSLTKALVAEVPGPPRAVCRAPAVGKSVELVAPVRKTSWLPVPPLPSTVTATALATSSEDPPR